MVPTNSVTRLDSMLSIELRLSWAPLSTSCRRPLASRSRSNRVVVSERSMPCVSSISATVTVAVWRDCSTAPRVFSCSSFMVRWTASDAFAPASLMMRASSFELSIIVPAKAIPLDSIDCTAESVALPTWAVNAAVLLEMAESSRPDLSSRMPVSSAERWLTAAAISSARPTRLRATSELTPSRVRSTSSAFCLSTPVTPVDSEFSERSTSPAVERMLSLDATAAPVIAWAVTVASDSRALAASPELILIACESSSMRPFSRSAADLLRVSISRVTASARPIRSSSNRLMRISMLSATCVARLPREVSTSPIRLSSAATTSLPPSATVLAMSATRVDKASLRLCVRLSSASWNRPRRWSSEVVTSIALAPTRPSKPSR